jgi:hypothetical protein
MAFRRRFCSFRLTAVALLVAGALCPALQAQAPEKTLLALGPLPDAPTPFVEAVSPTFVTPSGGISEHKFWDNRNRVLFAATAALAGADFAVTRANLQSGGQELNPLVRIFGRSTAGLAANFVGETAGVVGISYFLHKTGHHKLERAVSLVNIGSSAGAVTFGLTHR